MPRFHTTKIAVFAAGIFCLSTGVGAVEPVKLRWASDHGGPPHPAAIAEVYFAEQVEKKIPGSKVQIYWAKSLYTIPQGVKAMTQGNLEMITGQFGKTASVEPLANVVGAGRNAAVGPSGFPAVAMVHGRTEHRDRLFPDTSESQAGRDVMPGYVRDLVVLAQSAAEDFQNVS